MGTENVSTEYPPIPEFPQLQRKVWGTIDEPAEELSEFVGADCWGVYIANVNGNIQPIYNTYALDEAIGHSFNVGMIQNDQYDYEQKVRDRIIECPNDYLIALQPNQILRVLLGGNIFRYIDFRKANDGWRMDDYYHLPTPNM